jgi:arylsulfatase A-like enzyme
MRLGHSDPTDMVAIGFSTLDKVGHEFGPESHEVQDVLIRLDRTLAVFFAGLDTLVGAGNYTVALTSDHGVSPIPERAIALGLDAGRVETADVVAAMENALGKTLGGAGYVVAVVDGDIYLRDGALEQMRATPAAAAAARDALRAIPGVLDVYARDRIDAKPLTDDPIGRRIANGYDRERSGDLTVVLRPYWLMYEGATTHGAPYGYDTRVPLFLMGKGIVAGEYLAPASPADVAPTLAFLAGVTLPRPDGRVLAEALASASRRPAAARAPAQESIRR